ncbi:MAG: hypothetical protein EPN21_14520 [Methylococcaceae bacterium]|nr:MAG: hypothetical protein EPN21_14520 [Methylococcaceae bacterium]
MPTLFFLSAPPTEKTAAMAGFTPDSVAQWLHNAPTANQAQFCIELCRRVGEINRAGFGGRDLLHLAETLRPSVLSVQSYLLARVAGKAYPLDQDDQAAGEVLLNLGREYGQMYSVLLQEIEAAMDSAAERPLGLLIHRLIRCVSLLLLVYYSLHLKVPAWLWRDMHAIYRLAMQKRKTDERQRDAAAVHQTVSLSVKEVYVQALLLGMADPYRLQGSEILALYQQLETLAPMVRLSPLSGKTSAEEWLVQLDKDTPPIRQAAGSVANGLLIDCKTLDQHLAGQIERIRVRSGRFEPSAAIESTGGLSYDLLRHLRRCWRCRAEEGAEFVAVEGGICITSGFRATHALLSPARASAPAVETAAPSGGLLLKTTHSALTSRPENWEATLLGEGQYCCDGDIPGRLVLGALLSYRPLSYVRAAESESAEPPVVEQGLAVVDRVFMDRLGGVVKFSLRKLTGKVLPAGLQPAKLDPKNPNIYQRALVYVDDRAAPVRSYLILESLRQQEGSVVRLLTDHGMTFVKLAGRENIALGCSRFACVAAVD